MRDFVLICLSLGAVVQVFLNRGMMARLDNLERRMMLHMFDDDNLPGADK